MSRGRWVAGVFAGLAAAGALNYATGNKLSDVLSDVSPGIVVAGAGAAVTALAFSGDKFRIKDEEFGIGGTVAKGAGITAIVCGAAMMGVEILNINDANGANTTTTPAQPATTSVSGAEGTEPPVPQPIDCGNFANFPVPAGTGVNANLQLVMKQLALGGSFDESPAAESAKEIVSAPSFVDDIYSNGQGPTGQVVQVVQDLLKIIPVDGEFGSDSCATFVTFPPYQELVGQ